MGDLLTTCPHCGKARYNADPWGSCATCGGTGPREHQRSLDEAAARGALAESDKPDADMDYRLLMATQAQAFATLVLANQPPDRRPQED